jgi:hypothetical protein
VKVLISRGAFGEPRTAREVKHEQGFAWHEALDLVRTLSDALKTKHGIVEGEPTPFWEEHPNAQSAARLETAVPQITPRHRLCALVDALEVLDAELGQGASLELTLTVRR